MPVHMVDTVRDQVQALQEKACAQGYGSAATGSPRALAWDSLCAATTLSQTLEAVSLERRAAVNLSMMHAIEESWGMKFTAPGRSFLKQARW